jgi:hypothetical protein
MALNKKTTTYVVAGIVVLGGLYVAKKQLLNAVGKAQATNNAAIVQHAQTTAALTAATSLSGNGMGDTAPVTTPPPALVATSANLTQIATIISTTVTALGGVVTLILGYLALEEKRRTLYVKKD